MKQLAADNAPATPELSIVCATRNVEHCIGELLSSYRRERTEDCELILMDSASTDETWNIILKHRDIVAVAKSEPDTGIYDAWNKALPLCSGRYVSFIGADDRLAEGSVRHLVHACRRAENPPHVIAGFNILTRSGVPVALLGAPFDRRRLPARMMLAQVMSAHHLEWLVQNDGFDASFRSSADYELLLRLRQDVRVEVINHVLAFMEDGGTSRKNLQPFFENYRARQQNGIPRWICAALLARALAGRFVRRTLID